MASVYHLYDDAIHFQDDIVIEYKKHSFSARRIHFAATKIQSVFRGYQVRQEMKKLNRAATMIQKYVRGWLLRYHLPDIMHEYYDLKCLRYYNGMATRIQAIWKGYQVRKYEVCVKDVIKDRIQMLQANEEIKRIFSQHQQGYTGGVCDIDDNKIYIEKLLVALFDRHHLLGTHQKTGVLSNHGKKELSQLETFLDCIPWKAYMKKLRKIYNACANQQEEYHYMFDEKKLRREEDLLRLRDAQVVLQKPVDDQNTHEKPFILSTKLEKKPYEKLTTNEGKYTVVKTKILRSFDKSKNICDRDFNLDTLKRVASDSDVPPYYIDFWFQNCRLHNL